MPGRIALQDNDYAYQHAILKKVSRTFALTIPQMPSVLRDVVGNAYLLCRIVDTIEDDTGLRLQQKIHFCRQFVEVVAGRYSAQAFAQALCPLLSECVSADERDLIKNTARIIRLTHRYGMRQRMILLRCVDIMANGMLFFQTQLKHQGLPTRLHLDRYCYYVAGVVGEMLTELYCLYSPAFARHKTELMQLAVSFGQGLQMTNILKDINEDYKRGVCWLPQDVFHRFNVEIAELNHAQRQAGFHKGIRELVAQAHGHLINALNYTLLVPKEERGIRKFCLWAIGMALLTLNKVNKHTDFSHGRQVKISRRSVVMVVWTTRFLLHSNRMLRWMFRLVAARLPAPRHEAYDWHCVQQWQQVAMQVHVAEAAVD